MADEAGGRRRRSTYAERKAERTKVEDPAEVLDAAARYLEARPRSTAEVRRRLTTMGYRSTLVDGAITRMTEMGYLNDEAFARAWVDSRDRAKPRGEHALRRELEVKGVERGLIDLVLEERRSTSAASDRSQVDAGPDDAAAERLLRRKIAPIMREGDPRRRRQRAYALLARSGFAPDVCSTVTIRVLADTGTNGADDDPEVSGMTET